MARSGQTSCARNIRSTQLTGRLPNPDKMFMTIWWSLYLRNSRRRLVAATALGLIAVISTEKSRTQLTHELLPA